jgi:phage terminase large subunit-like protein
LAVAKPQHPLPSSRELKSSTKQPTRRKRAPAKPFTLPHFRSWASDLILDTGESWHPEPFQDAFVEDVFTGCPECWLVVPEGNGKTTLLAGIALYHCEQRPHASVPVAAASREQAEHIYRQAEGFVLRSDRLHAMVHSAIQAAKGKRKTEVPRFACLEGYRRINHHGGGRIQCFAADDRTGDGVLPTLAIIDEPHRQRDLSLYRTWAGKLDKRQGQLVAISTSGEVGSDFEATRTNIRRVATDVIRRGSFIRASSARLILHEWAVPEDGDVEDFAVVKSANPFSGITVASLAEKYASPSFQMAHWLRFVCNRPSRTVTAAITEAEWAGAKTTDEIPPGTPIWAGLDVAWKYDTTALVPLWVRDPEYRLFGPATVLVPPRDGNMLDSALVEKAILDLHERTPIHTVVMDMSHAAQLAQWIAATIGALVIDRQQTNPLLVNDYDQFMEALRLGWLHHSGDADFTQHALNAIAYVLPLGDTKFERPVQSRRAEQERRVIDALTAAAMVHSTATTLAQPVKPSIYETRDPIVLGEPAPPTRSDAQLRTLAAAGLLSPEELIRMGYKPNG